jgi:hypothetical protein
VWGDGDAAEEEQAEERDEDMDVDMNDEQDDFLKFAREALGISDESWKDIIDSRRQRGAFVPESKTAKASSSKSAGPKFMPAASADTMDLDSDSVSAPKGKGPNMALNSFETMMAAMESELEHAKAKGGAASSFAAPKVQFKKPASSTATASTSPSTSTATSKAKKNKKKNKSKYTSLTTLPSEAHLDNMDDDELAAMDAELRAALEDAGEYDDDDGDIPEVGQLSEDQQREYRMMRDLLESASQGHDGAAGALLARLGEGMGNK